MIIRFYNASLESDIDGSSAISAIFREHKNFNAYIDEEEMYAVFVDPDTNTVFYETNLIDIGFEDTMTYAQLVSQACTICIWSYGIVPDLIAKHRILSMDKPSSDEAFMRASVIHWIAKIITKKLCELATPPGVHYGVTVGPFTVDVMEKIDEVLGKYVYYAVNYGDTTVNVITWSQVETVIRTHLSSIL